MSESEEDNFDALPQGELLTLPDGAIPAEWLTEFFARRAALIHQQDSNELALELSGDSSLHLMIFRDMDTKEKRRRKEEDNRRRLLAEQELQEYRERTDRQLARIDEQERIIAKRWQEIEDNALRLHDGRRVYVDGNQYRDENGTLLAGSPRDEAAELHRGHPQASTWQQKQDTAANSISTAASFFRLTVRRKRPRPKPSSASVMTARWKPSRLRKHPPSPLP
jgi:hypothetical protein